MGVRLRKRNYWVLVALLLPCFCPYLFSQEVPYFWNNGHVLAKKAIFQNDVDTATCFQVLDAAGAVVTNHDCTNKRFGMGTAFPATVAHIVRGLEGSVPGLLTFSTLVIQSNEFATSDASISLLAGTSGDSIVEFADSGDRDSGFISYNHAADSMQFGTNAIGNRMFIDSAGNVGIGTAAPGRVLEISNNLAILRIADAGATTADQTGSFIEFGKNGGTWTKPANVTGVFVYVLGGGSGRVFVSWSE